MALQPVALYTLEVPCDMPCLAESEIEGAVFRITMAAIDPNAEPEDAEKPRRATLKILRRPGSLLDEDSDEEDEEDEDEDDDEDKSAKGTSKKAAEKALQKALKKGEENKMAVDGDSDSDEDEDDGGEFEEFVLCTLDPEKNYQQALDVTIGAEEEVAFKVIGNYPIFLTGNYVEPHSHDDHDSDSDDYDEPPSDDELMYGLGGGADSESDELDDTADPRITEVDSDEEEKKEAPKKLSKAEKKALKRSAPDSDDAAAKEQPEPKLSKKQQKKLKANDGKAVDASADTPDGKKKVQFAAQLEQGPTASPASGDKKKPEAKKAQDTGKPAEPATRVVNGVTIEDKKVGSGPQAKAGNRLSMRYIGKLAKSGKEFDKNTSGKPFSFKLGKGEVIKGWDIGLQGMQVGGERRITIPANLAYGNKSLPGIPKGSTLKFDVKLLEIK